MTLILLPTYTMFYSLFDDQSHKMTVPFKWYHLKSWRKPVQVNDVFKLPCPRNVKVANTLSEEIAPLTKCERKWQCSAGCTFFLDLRTSVKCTLSKESLCAAILTTWPELPFCTRGRVIHVAGLPLIIRFSPVITYESIHMFLWNTSVSLSIE